MKRPIWILLVLVLSSACGQQPAVGEETSVSAADDAASAGPATPDGTPATAAAALPEVVASVNGEAVERWELENAVRAAEAGAGGPVPADRRDEIMRGLLDQLVQLHLLAQEARARNLLPSDADVDAQLAQIRQEFPTEEAFLAAMAEDGTSLAQVRQDVARRLSVDLLLDQEVRPALSVTADEVRAFYDENVERFQEGESVRASHILITVPENASDEERQQARVRTEEILNRLHAGADFATIAREESEDPGTAPQGGELGFFTRGQMVPPFEEAAFSLEPGAISAPVETPYGFHIIQVHERRGPRTTPFEEIRPQIEQFLQSQQGQARTDEFVQRLMANAKIDIHL